jgi:hypothetical protein
VLDVVAIALEFKGGTLPTFLAPVRSTPSVLFSSILHITIVQCLRSCASCTVPKRALCAFITSVSNHGHLPGQRLDPIAVDYAIMERIGALTGDGI